MGKLGKIGKKKDGKKKRKRASKHRSVPVEPVSSAEPEACEPLDPGLPLPQPTRTGKVRTMAKKALCVGIDAYPTAPLGGCVADATEWSRLFSDFGFSTQLLTNTQATRAGILTAVQNLLAGSSRGDVLTLQFAGHGTHVPDISGDEADGQDEAFCPYDFASGNLLIDDDVRSLLNGLPAGVGLTCFIDCCHSATITRSILAPTPAPAPGKARYVELTPEQVQAYLAARRNLPTGGSRAIVTVSGMREVLFSACRANEVAYESNGRGAFSVAAQASLRRALSSGGTTNGQLH